MLDHIDELRAELDELGQRLADPALIADQGRYATAARRYRELEEVVGTADRLAARRGDLGAARELLAEAGSDGGRELAEAEVAAAEDDIERLEAALRRLLLPKDPNDDRAVIVEIRGAAGGEEANLFAADLFAMYENLAAVHGWRLEVLNTDRSAMGGINEITFRVSGDGAWSRLRFEAGTHRVQRVPVTESQGRIHTSTATVMVLPEADEIEVEIDPNDLQIDVFRASGPGGQSVNTTDSAVRVTHEPTGLVVSMQDEKSQLQNKARALTVLRSRLLAAEQERQAAEASETRRRQVAGGGREAKIRTYNFKENRVTHHEAERPDGTVRPGITVYKLDRVLAGELDEITDALIADEQAHRLAGA